MDDAEKQTTARILEVEGSLKAQVPQLESLISETREMKKAAEAAMGRVFKGTVVYIIGAINDL